MSALRPMGDGWTGDDVKRALGIADRYLGTPTEDDEDPEFAELSDAARTLAEEVRRLRNALREAGVKLTAHALLTERVRAAMRALDGDD